jgi:hypothetical protein
MNRPGRWISLLPIVALVPRLGLVVLAADRQAVAPETRSALLWISSAALAALVGLAEVYVGMAVVSRRSGGLALVWVAITISLNALIVPLSVSGLEAVPVWSILSSRPLRVAWGAGLGLLSTLCVCGCLWADILREGSELAEAVSQLLGRVADEKDRREAAEAQVAALQAEVERSASATQDAPAPLPTHGACPLCGYWDADQRKVAGHIRQCQRRAARSQAPETTAPTGSLLDHSRAGGGGVRRSSVKPPGPDGASEA